MVPIRRLSKVYLYYIMILQFGKGAILNTGVDEK